MTKVNNDLESLELGDDIHAFLAAHEAKELLRFVAVGSVDDGKSTLIGRLLHDTGQVYADQLDEARSDSADGEIDFALLTDGLKAEREQGITIDAAYRYFATEKRKFIIADTPGHVQYTRNMVTGASTANAAIILIDARLGVLQQSRRHAYIASMLGIPHLIVCINKMDLVEYAQETFDSIVKVAREFMGKLSFKEVSFFPISALKGDNIVTKSENTPWFSGKTILKHLETVPTSHGRNLKDFRFPVQYVLRPHLDYRAFAGQISSGVVRRGDEIMVMPSGQRSRIKAIDMFDGELEEAFAPLSVALRLEHEIDISRGDMIVHVDNPPHSARRIKANLVWMSERPLQRDRSYHIKHTSHTVRTSIERVDWKIDPDTLASIDTDTLELNEIGQVSLLTYRPVYFDSYRDNRDTGAFIVIDSLSNDTVAAGVMIEPEEGELAGSFVRFQQSSISKEEREGRLKQVGGFVWIAGLPASGRSKIAYLLERLLFDGGYLPHVVDPDDVMSKIETEFSDDSVWAPSSLGSYTRGIKQSTDSGLLTIGTFSIPRRGQREALKKIIGAERWLEVFVDASVEVCRERILNDNKPNPQKRLGLLESQAASFVKPLAPKLSLSHQLSAEEAAAQIFAFLKSEGWLS